MYYTSMDMIIIMDFPQYCAESQGVDFSYGNLGASRRLLHIVSFRWEGPHPEYNLFLSPIGAISLMNQIIIFSLKTWDK